MLTVWKPTQVLPLNKPCYRILTDSAGIGNFEWYPFRRFFVAKINHIRRLLLTTVGGDGNAVDIPATVWYVVYLPKQEGDESHETTTGKKMEPCSPVKARFR